MMIMNRFSGAAEPSTLTRSGLPAASHEVAAASALQHFRLFRPIGSLETALYGLLVGLIFSVAANGVEPSDASNQFYQPTLEQDSTVPQPPQAAAIDFEHFLERLSEASQRDIESMILQDDALDSAERVLLASSGVPDEIEMERHLPFLMVNPEAIFGLYADLRTLERGLGLYQQNCSSCHGIYGRGNGAATPQWYVGNYPRNFTYGSYKSRTTVYGTSPTDGDLFRTLTRGLYGSTMPSFRHLSEQDRWALVQFIKSLANYYDENEELVINRFDPEQGHAAEVLDMAGETPVTLESVTRGRTLFVKHACVSCHQGQKPKPVGLKRTEGPFANWSDEMGRPVYTSRDLTTPVFLAGASSKDLFRIIVGGPNVGPMPTYQDLPPEDCWDLVHYMQSCFKPDYPQAPASADAAAPSNENSDGESE